MLDFFTRSGTAGKPPLRVGLLIDSTDLMQAFAMILDSVQAADFAKVVLVVRHVTPAAAAAAAAAATGLLARLRDPKLRRALLFELYWRWDQRNVSAELNPATAVDCSDRLRGIPCLDVQP